VSVSKNLTRMRISNLVALVNSLAIVFLAVMFYVVFYRQYRIIALVALICFVAEAIVLAVSKIGAYGLIPLSQEFVEAGAPEPSYLQTLGEFLYQGVDRLGYDIHMLFFCLGGILWYYLLYSSRLVPRPLALWGLIAICLLTIPVLLMLYTRRSTPLMILGLPYAPFELVLGIWLIAKGFH
jgi:predicted neutral ceramidase superfamily lipid hydrolase